MDTTHADHRNKVFLLAYTEYVYRRLLKSSNYSMEEIDSIVRDYASLTEINHFFDNFTIKFTEWVVSQNWDKTSASLGVDEKGENIAKSTEELLKDFKQLLGTTTIEELSLKDGK